MGTSSQLPSSGVQQTHAPSQSRQGSCIPTISSPGASPFQSAPKEEPQNNSRSLLSRVSERSGRLAAAALSAETTEKIGEGGAIRRDTRYGSVHQPFLHSS